MRRDSARVELEPQNINDLFPLPATLPSHPCEETLKSFLSPEKYPWDGN